MNAPANLLTRDDTFFGVCQGLGEELHVPANLFRLALVPLILLQPLLAVAIYAALGTLVFVARVVLRPRKRANAAPSAPQPVAAATDQDNDAIRLAA